MTVITATSNGTVTHHEPIPTPSLADQLTEMLAWWQPALGLGHWRISIEAKKLDSNRGQCCTDGDYPNAMIEINEKITENRWTGHDKIEELIVHELLHAATQHVQNAAWDMHKSLPKAERKAAWRTWSHGWETMTETMARSFVAAAYARRDGLPPSIGGIVTAAKETV